MYWLDHGHKVSMCYGVPKSKGPARGLRDTITIDTECTWPNRLRSHFSLDNYSLVTASA